MFSGKDGKHLRTIAVQVVSHDSDLFALHFFIYTILRALKEKDPEIFSRVVDAFPFALSNIPLDLLKHEREDDIPPEMLEMRKQYLIQLRETIRSLGKQHICI